MAMTPLEPRLPRFTGWLRPVVDAVARVKASVHRKLLFGFLAGALLLVGMAVLSLVVIGRMNERVSDLDRLQEKVEPRPADALRGHRAEPLPGDGAADPATTSTTARSPTPRRPSPSCSTSMEQADPADAAFFEGVRTTQRGVPRSRAHGSLALYEAGRHPGRHATSTSSEEHPTSHMLEASMRTLIAEAERRRWCQARAAFDSDRTCSPAIVIAFSAASVVVALLLGLRPLVGVHPARPQDGARRWPGSPTGDFDAARRGPEPRRVRQAGARPEQHQRAAGARCSRSSGRWPTRLERDERVARARQRGEVAVPGQRQPRAANADERDPRLHRRAPRRRGRSAQRRAEGVARLGPARRAGPARADQRDPRPVEDRGREAHPRCRAVRPARARRGGRRAAPLAGRAEGDPARLARRRARRPRWCSTASASARSSSTCSATR